MAAKGSTRKKIELNANSEKRTIGARLIAVKAISAGLVRSIPSGYRKTGVCRQRRRIRVRVDAPLGRLLCGLPDCRTFWRRPFRTCFACCPHYNEWLITEDQCARFQVVLVSPRNPLNIGAAARAMANFGFAQLKVVAPYAPLWQEAKSAVGANHVVAAAVETATVSEAVAACTLVLGTGTLTYRKPEQRVIQLPDLAPLVRREMERDGRVALVFGSEKHGLTREDLSCCHAMVEIPTCANQPSMNLGQAVAVCLYELAARDCAPGAALAPRPSAGERPASSAKLELLAGIVERAMAAANYSPAFMREANRHDLRLLLRRIALSEKDVRRILGIFRRILWRLEQ